MRQVEASGREAFYCSSGPALQPAAGEWLSLSSAIDCTMGALSCFHAMACLVLNKILEDDKPLCFFQCIHNKYFYTTFPKIQV